MATIEIGEAVGSGFGLIRRKPLAVLLWGLVMLVASAALIAVYAPVYLAMATQMIQSAQSGVPTPPNFATMAPQMAQINALGLLGNIGVLFVEVIVYCAVFRAVLKPDESRFAYLRVGMSEVLLFILGIGAYIALVFGMLIVVVVVAVFIGILVGVHAVAAAVVLGVVAAIALFVGLIYIALRFSMVGPMIVSDGKFHLGESWTLTRGKAGSLFLMALCVFLVILACEIVFAVVLVAVGLGALGALSGGTDSFSTFFQQPPQVLLAKLSPVLIVYAVIWAPVVGCVFAIAGAPWAKAYRDLAGADMDATFA